MCKALPTMALPLELSELIARVLCSPNTPHGCGEGRPVTHPPRPPHRIAFELIICTSGQLGKMSYGLIRVVCDAPEGRRPLEGPGLRKGVVIGCKTGNSLDPLTAGPRAPRIASNAVARASIERHIEL